MVGDSKDRNAVAFACEHFGAQPHLFLGDPRARFNVPQKKYMSSLGVPAASYMYCELPTRGNSPLVIGFFSNFGVDPEAVPLFRWAFMGPGEWPGPLNPGDHERAKDPKKLGAVNTRSAAALAAAAVAAARLTAHCDRARVQELLKSRCYGIMLLYLGGGVSGAFGGPSFCNNNNKPASWESFHPA